MDFGDFYISLQLALQLHTLTFTCTVGVSPLFFRLVNLSRLPYLHFLQLQPMSYTELLSLWNGEELRLEIRYQVAFKLTHDAPLLSNILLLLLLRNIAYSFNLSRLCSALTIRYVFSNLSFPLL